MKIQINMPQGAKEIIKKLHIYDFEAFVVGGCVRDTILGKNPKDWDITTNAKPQNIMDIFDGHRMVNIGEKHGTISIFCIDKYYEVTTYRIDGEYSDNRRPSFVKFTDNIKEDLQRRDFTINAMAYNDNLGIVDCFNGINDLKNGIIRCVGNCEERFNEDYLRIIRAYRFAAVLNFSLSDDIVDFTIKNCDKLKDVAAERIQQELVKLITSENFDKIQLFFDHCAAVLFPEIENLKNFEQNNPFHCYDVYEHSLNVMQNTPSNISLRLAALLHDTGKFFTKTIDKDGCFHFYGHAKVSVDIAKSFMKHWRFDNLTTHNVTTIIAYHDIDIIADISQLKKLLGKLGKVMLGYVITFQKADNMAKTSLADKKLQNILAAEALLKEIIAKDEPTRISDLAINGEDIMAYLDLPSSPKIGKILNNILEQVIENPKLNDKSSLIALLNSYLD